jgi:hypothetical protein
MAGSRIKTTAKTAAISTMRSGGARRISRCACPGAVMVERNHSIARLPRRARHQRRDGEATVKTRCKRPDFAATTLPRHPVDLID